MAVPNVGDILMLSQLAWRIGRAFTAGRKDAPAELQNVEVDISGLAQALKHLAEVLHVEVDSSLISKADQETRDGVAVILSSCQRTVHDLDSLVDRYQVIRKHRTPGGFTIERSWSDLVLAQYETVIWTTEGGSLHDLSSLLQMHTKSISLLAEAVKRRLEGIVTPMAKRFDSMYDLPGSLEDQLEEVSRFVKELALAAPSSQTPPIPQRNPARSPTTEALDPFGVTSIPITPPALSPRRTRMGTSTPRTTERSISAAALTSKSRKEDMSASCKDESTTPTIDASRECVPGTNSGGHSIRDSTSSYASSNSSARASLNSRHILIPVVESLPLSWSPELSSIPRPHKKSSTRLPTPSPRPSSAHSAPDVSRVKSNSTLSPFPARQDSISKLHRSSTTASQKAAFERDAFRNSAILCDVRGTLIEYSQPTRPDPNSPTSPAEISMIPACTTCRIAIVRKLTTPNHVQTSLFALSSDSTTRLEIPLPSTPQIPYSSFFSPTKISLTTPSTLLFHDITYGTRLQRSARSTWITFHFDNIAGATLFQNEITGKILLASFRTTKTLRCHEGRLGRWAYQEQMCALECLRVWEDGETGEVVVLVHFDAGFRGGWLGFCVNSREGLVGVVSVGSREVRVRGLDVPVEEAVAVPISVPDADAELGSTREKRMDSDGSPDSMDAQPSSTLNIDGESEIRAGVKKTNKAKKEIDKKKIITGARIEFATESEKKEFLELVAEYQRPERLCDAVGGADGFWQGTGEGEEVR